HFEELWLTQNLDGPIAFSEMPGMYNPFEHPRATRAALPIPPFSEMLGRLAEIRARVLERLDTMEFDESNPLLAGGYVYHMVLQHEYQHNETILQTLQLKQGDPYRAPRAIRKEHPGDPARRTGTAPIPAGTYSIGTDDRSEAYDNERPRHEVHLDAFEIDRAPVTNGDYLEFMSDDGYADMRLWSDAGKAWLAESGAVAPKYWSRGGGAWISRSMDCSGPVDATRPVGHVCFH